MMNRPANLDDRSLHYAPAYVAVFLRFGLRPFDNWLGMLVDLLELGALFPGGTRFDWFSVVCTTLSS